MRDEDASSVNGIVTLVAALLRVKRSDVIENDVISLISLIEGVVAPWCNPLKLQPEQSGGVGSSPGRAPPLWRAP